MHGSHLACIRRSDLPPAMNPQVQTPDGTRLNLDLVEPVASTSFLRRPLALHENHIEIAERFQILAHRLNRARSRKRFQTILITSAVPAEGKSTVALNLGATLAQNGARTLLIDADLRVPEMYKTFAFEDAAGLAGVLAGDAALNDTLRFATPLGLYILPAGDRVKNPAPLLESAAFKTLLVTSCDNFDWVIIDSPPLNPLADSHYIACSADAILLVVKWGFTPKKELD